MPALSFFTKKNYRKDVEGITITFLTDKEALCVSEKLTLLENKAKLTMQLKIILKSFLFTVQEQFIGLAS